MFTFLHLFGCLYVYIFPRVWVTVDKVWIYSWSYWTQIETISGSSAPCNSHTLKSTLGRTKSSQSAVAWSVVAWWRMICFRAHLFTLWPLARLTSCSPDNRLSSHCQLYQDWPTPLFAYPRHGRRRKHCFQQFFYCSMARCLAVVLILSRAYETNEQRGCLQSLSLGTAFC
jgi:hypothetical protein